MLQRDPRRATRSPRPASISVTLIRCGPCASSRRAAPCSSRWRPSASPSCPPATGTSRPSRPWCCRSLQPAHERPYGFLVVGLNRYSVLDGEYRAFVELIAQHLSAGLAAARAYDAERRRAAQLEELDRAKTAFFSNVSHEFRTPLTLMLGPLQDALGEPAGLPPERLELVHRNALRLLKLVNALLDFSRAEAGRMRAEFRPTDVAKLTADLAGTFREATDRGGVRPGRRLRVAGPPGLRGPRPVGAHRPQPHLQRVQGHARRARSRSGCATCDDHLELSVKDTGTGIEPQEMERLFQRFHRVRSVARSYEGTGIGLALVKELTELHGGEVTATSTLGEGSEFIVTLPFGSAHLPADQVYAESVEPAASIAALFVEEAMSWIETSADRLTPGAFPAVPGPGSAESAPSGAHRRRQRRPAPLPDHAAGRPVRRRGRQRRQRGAAGHPRPPARPADLRRDDVRARRLRAARGGALLPGDPGPAGHPAVRARR